MSRQMSEPTREEIEAAISLLMQEYGADLVRHTTEDRKKERRAVITVCEVARAHLRSLSAEVGGAKRWRHVKRGTEYVEIGRATLQHSVKLALFNGQRMVVYRDEHPDGQLWARAEDEFDDGRFVEIAAAPSPMPVKDADETKIVDEVLRRFLAIQGCGFELGESDRISMRAAIAPLLAQKARWVGWAKELGDRCDRAEATVSRLREALTPFIRSIYDHEAFKDEILKNKDWARLIECFRDGRDLLAALASKEPQG